jgi:Ricin-type beta-trefoil lectin domain-like
VAPRRSAGGKPGGGPPPTPPGLTATQAFLTVDQTLNGQPGWVSVHGNVFGGGAPLSGVSINVNFEKQQPDGSWLTMSSAHPTVSGGAYSVENWRVGDGQWRTRVVLPAQGSLAESMSDYHPFEIKAGYRLVNRHSGRCMSISQNLPANGTAILQWACSPAPSPGDGQVLSMIPMGGGWYELAFNSTGKCLDVPGASAAAGALLQEWDCLGPNQANQLWQVIPIAGQDGWFAFGVKHTGMCADVVNSRTDDGARIDQWPCAWTGNQQWAFQSIG